MASKQNVLFSIKCQCSVYKNGLLITSKKKSKFSNLVLNLTLKIISVVPLNSKQQQLVFEVKKLKNIHRKFINQGKISLQFNEDTQKNLQSNSNIQGDVKIERLSQILVDAASSQNLQLLIKKIVDLKISMKNENKNVLKKQKESLQIKKIPSKIKNQVNQNKAHQKLQKQQLMLAQRKKIIPSKTLLDNQQQKKSNKIINRKSLMNCAYKQTDQQSQAVLQNNKDLIIPNKQLDIFQLLPSILLQKIFEYCSIQLRMRLINKKFDEFVLRNIQTLKFNDQVDQKSFNKMAKFAVNIQGRLKNVKNVNLMNKNNDDQLEKNKAKSLYFGEWKQISKKNIIQIKFLYLHTLQIPYQIKFQFQNIYGIRLRQLHLRSKTQITTPNFFVKDENILHLFKYISTLQAFSIPYINSSLLDEIAKIKDRTIQIRSLQFGSVNQNKKDTTWYLFHTYQNLKNLKVQRVLQGGILKKDLKYKLTFPMFIQQLQVGSFLDQQIVMNLPTTLRKLKLIGDQYLNRDIQNMFLPYLRCLDVNECTLIRPSVIQSLQMCSNLNIITNWEKQDVDYYKQLTKQKNIRIVSLDGMIKK